MSLARSSSRPARARVIALALISIGGPPLAMRAPDVVIAPERLAVLEANVLIYQLGDSQPYPRREWTLSAQKNLDWALRERARSNGAGIVDPKGIEEREYALFSSWVDRSLDQIDARAEGRAFPEVKSVTQWRYNRTLEPFRASFGVDHVLVTRFRDGYTTAGQVVADVSSGILYGIVHQELNVRPQSIACVVSLTSGRVVWCARDASGRDDLRITRLAKATVDHLLVELLPR
jgi:hypothetical protein